MVAHIQLISGCQVGWQKQHVQCRRIHIGFLYCFNSCAVLTKHCDVDSNWNITDPKVKRRAIYVVSCRIQHCPLRISQECVRPYHGERSGSRLISEDKHRRARLVLRWGTTWEHHVSHALLALFQVHSTFQALEKNCNFQAIFIHFCQNALH